MADTDYKAQEAEFAEEAAILKEQKPREDGKPHMRACTDICCLMVFLIFMCGMGHVWVTAHEVGNLKKLTSGFDWRGHICGVDADVIDLPSLFWCTKADPSGGGLQLTDGICVASCPTGTSTHHMCPDTPHFYELQMPVGAAQVVTVGVNRTLRRQTDYATIRLPGLGYCFPDPGAEDFESIVELIASQTELGTNGRSVMTMAHGVAESWGFLLGCLIFAIMGGYLFLFLLKTFIKPFVYTLGAILMILVVGSGAVLLYGSINNEYNVFTHVTTEPDKQKLYAQIAGGIVLILAIPVGCLLMAAKKAIEVTVACVKESCDLLVQLPSLLLQPITQIVIKGALLIFLLYGLLWAISMGRVHPDRQIDPLNPEGWADMEISGFSRGIDLDKEQGTMIFYWFCGMLWILEIVTAAGQFALSHAVVLYKTDGHKHFMPLVRGYMNAFAFHLGTLAFGGFIVGVLKLVTMIVSYLAKQMQNADGSQNAVAKCCACCCVGCLTCVTHLVEYLNEMVYTECTIHGGGYLASCSAAMSRLGKNPIVFATVKGTTSFVSVLGIGIMTLGPTFIVYKIQFSNWGTAIGDAIEEAGESLSNATGVASLGNVEGSVMGVMMSQSALGTTLAAAVIFFYVAQCFMEVFDHTANSLAYVILWLRELPGGADKFEEPESWKEAKKHHDVVEEENPYVEAPN